MSFFTVILLANSLTFAVTVAAAVKRPIGSYIIIVMFALGAWLSSLYQAVTGDGTFAVTLFTGVLAILLAGRILSNTRGLPRGEQS
jgi:hypothetical protein